jgi:hypothetical protein
MSTIRKAIADNDPKTEKFDSIKTSLDLLDKLASLKLEELGGQISSQLEDKKKFKTTHQEHTKSGTHITATDDSSNITSALNSIIDGFCAGSSAGTRKAVSAIVGTALTALLGSGEGQETYEISYAASAEDDILKRVDAACWPYGIAAKGITEKSLSPIAYVCVKSYIDPTDVHSTELVSMYREAARLGGQAGGRRQHPDGTGRSPEGAQGHEG